MRKFLTMALATTVMAATAATNPFFDYKNWKTPHGTYPFAQEATQYPHAVEGVLLEQQVVATSARRHNVDRGEDALVAELAVELQLHVAGTLEFLKDHLVHLAASLNEGCGDDGETASVLNVARSAKESLGTLQGIGVNTTTQNLATGRSDCIVGASQASD